MTDIFTTPLGADHDAPRPFGGPDAVVLAVHDARQAARHYTATLAMRCVAYAGPETGNPEIRSYVLRTGPVRYVVTSLLQVLSETGERLAAHLAAHGEGVLDLPLSVPDAYAAFDYAVDRGAVPLTEPHPLTDRHGTVVLAAIALPGHARLTLVDRTGYLGPYLPGYEVPPPHLLPPTGPLVVW